MGVVHRGRRGAREVRRSPSTAGARLDRLVRQRRAKFIQRLRTENFRLPFDIDAGRLDDPNNRRRYLRPDTVTGN